MEFASWSPYNYVLGNPIKWVDEDGRSPGDPKEDLHFQITPLLGVGDLILPPGAGRLGPLPPAGSLLPRTGGMTIPNVPGEVVVPPLNGPITNPEFFIPPTSPEATTTTLPEIGDLPAPTTDMSLPIDNVRIDQAKSTEKETGSYTNEHESGQKYHGKGDRKRAEQSGKEKAKEYKDPVKNTDWTKAQNKRDAFKQEYKRMQQDRTNKYPEGHKNPKNYNKRQSPGKKYMEQDGA